MEMEEEVHRYRDNLTYNEIILMEGTDGHLLEGQGATAGPRKASEGLGRWRDISISTYIYKESVQ